MEKGSKNTKHFTDDNEDIEIRKIAHNKSENCTLVFLVIVFFLILITTLTYICLYNKGKNVEDREKIIEISKGNNKVLISNVGEITETYSNEMFLNKEKITIERINSIELIAKENVLKEEKIYFNVKLNIDKNDFNHNALATTNSELLMKISYSYDNENWTYINNVLQTNNTTITPLMGNYYDIAGIESEIRISTKKELTAKLNESKKMYWKIETIIKKQNKEHVENNLQMNFYLEYEDDI